MKNRLTGIVLFIVCLLLAPAAVRADSGQQGVISGTITDNQTNVVPNAGVTLEGNVMQAPRKTITRKDGTYSFTNVPNGRFSLTVTKEGWTKATVTDIFLGAGIAMQRVDVQLLQPTFTSVRTLGRVVTSATRNVFNSSTASQVVLSPQVFQTQGQTSVSRIFDQIPGVVADTLGGYNVSNQFAPKFVTVRDGLAYETEQTIDGHPLANGIQGAYRTNLLNTAIFEDVEIIKGPGAAPNVITGAINGAVNYRTKEPTSYPYFSIDAAADNFGGFPYSFTATGTSGNRKLGYAFVLANDLTEGPWIPKNVYQPIFNNSINGHAVAAQPVGYGSVGGSAPFWDASVSAVAQPINPYTEGGYTHSQLAKLRYHFSDATSFTGSYYGTQGGYGGGGGYIFVQNSTFTPGSGYAGALPTNANLLINLDAQVPGFFNNSEPIFEGELRTHRKTDTFLARWYSVHLNSYIYGGSKGGTQTSKVWGTVQLCPLGQSSDGFSGMCGPAGGPFTLPSTPTDFNGQPAALGLTNSYNVEDRRDHMNGASLEWDHPSGNNMYTLSLDKWVAGSYDVYSYASSGQYLTSLSIPAGARQTTTTLMLRALLNPTDKLSVTLANYLQAYNLYHSLDAGLTYSSNFQHRDDGRIGLTYHPNLDTSLRLAVGSSNTPPFAQLINNTSVPIVSFDQGSSIYVAYTSNGNIRPETAVGYDIGGDWRLGRDGQTVFSTDYYLTNLKNQFYYSTELVGTYDDHLGHGVHPYYQYRPDNLSDARYYGLELALYRYPAYGFGYTLSSALMRAYTYNLPPGFYDLPGGAKFAVNQTVLPNQNFTIGGTYSAGNAPYSTGNAEINYRTRNEWFFAFGETYHGPNNPEQLPAFFVARAAASKKYNSTTTMQLTVDNLFNTNSFPYEYLGFGVAIPVVQGAQYAQPAAANGIGGRIIRFSIHKDTGRPGT
ncbi:MAG: hypothetical protein DLM53_00305 [Candidatus Eremiobacter antarcticus]|nr:MAG: hypothetical protein DLM53_00305 [Candidatus Eremiobacter sp. RRmetagenome_bin22]